MTPREESYAVGRSSMKRLFSYNAIMTTLFLNSPLGTLYQIVKGYKDATFCLQQYSCDPYDLCEDQALLNMPICCSAPNQ